MSEKMVGDSPVEHSFKNKGTAKAHALPLVPIMLMQNSTDIGEARVEMTAAAAEICKRSLNQSWGCSDKTFRCSS